MGRKGGRERGKGREREREKETEKIVVGYILGEKSPVESRNSVARLTLDLPL